MPLRFQTQKPVQQVQVNSQSSSTSKRISLRDGLAILSAAGALGMLGGYALLGSAVSVEQPQSRPGIERKINSQEKLSSTITSPSSRSSATPHAVLHSPTLSAVISASPSPMLISSPLPSPFISHSRIPYAGSPSASSSSHYASASPSYLPTPAASSSSPLASASSSPSPSPFISHSRIPYAKTSQSPRILASKSPVSELEIIAEQVNLSNQDYFAVALPRDYQIVVQGNFSFPTEIHAVKRQGEKTIEDILLYTTNLYGKAGISRVQLSADRKYLVWQEGEDTNNPVIKLGMIIPENRKPRLSVVYSKEGEILAVKGKLLLYQVNAGEQNFLKLPSKF